MQWDLSVIPVYCTSTTALECIGVHCEVVAVPELLLELCPLSLQSQDQLPRLVGGRGMGGCVGVGAS